MRFHIPSFLQHMDAMIPLDIRIAHHHYIIYLCSDFPIRTDFLQETTADAVIKTFEQPLVSLPGPEERSPIKGLLDTHVGKLRGTLLGTQTYLQKIKIVDTQGRVDRYETHLDIIDLQDIIRTIRLEDDTERIWNLIKHDDYCSVRLTEQKVLLNFGKTFSKRRITEALEALEMEGLITKNGRIRTYGREILGKI